MRTLDRRFLTSPARLSLICAAAVLGAGCANLVGKPNDAHAPYATPASTQSATPVPVVRSGRYTLVELLPEAAQKDLLLAVVEVSVPAEPSAVVRDAMARALMRSGYALCDAAQARDLYELPLPAVHHRLGPLRLRDALQTLAGPAWGLQVDESTRRVCFAPSEARAPTASSTDAAPAPTPAAR